MAAIIRYLLVIATVLVTVGCAVRGDFDCCKSLCGCSSNQTESATLQFTDADGSPNADAMLICHDNGEQLGVTNPNGLVELQIAGEATPGCGFMPNCQVAYLRKKMGASDVHFGLLDSYAE